MGSTVAAGAAIAIKRTGNIVSESQTGRNAGTRNGFPDRSDSDDSEWFADMARGLLSKDAGFALHVITGFEERTCYRYAAGDTKPPAYFLRAILRSDQGEPFLLALMDGCEARWWVDYKRHHRMGHAADGAR